MFDALMLRAGGAALFFAVVVAPAAPAAEAIFPAPLHLTRQIEDPISGKTVVLQEYAYGNRLVSVRGARTSIADYEKSELIEIDREAGTYSVTRFDVIARAATSLPKSTSPPKPLRSAGSKFTKSGRTGEFFEGEIESNAGRQRVEVAVDRGVLVSRTAFEILTGAAYPSIKSAEHDVVLAAAKSRADQTYALPIQQIVRHEMEGQVLEFRTTILRVGSEPPPADLVSIPAGARLVDSRAVAVRRELDRIDNPSIASPESRP